MKGAYVISVLALLVAGAVFFSASAPKEINVAAMPGNEFQQDSLIVGGVEVVRKSTSIKQATTTVCAIKSPSATSTLTHAAIRVDVASSTATIFDLAKATTAFATTTALGTAHAVGAGTQDFILASTSPAAGDAVVLAPNSFIVFGARQGISSGDAAGTGFVPRGECQAEFVQY